MKKSFICSLICSNGIIGGGLSVENTEIIYKTNKLTVSETYRNLAIPFNGIYELSWKWIVFPIAIFRMTNGERYKFIIFNKKRFNKYYTEIKQG